MIDLQFVTEFMLQHFEQVHITQGGQHFLARCLLCGDSKKSPYKKRFNLNWNDGVPGYHCFNCGESGNFYLLYSTVKGISYEEALAEVNKWDKKRFKRRCKKDKRKPITKKSEEKFNFNYILDDCYSIDSIPESFTAKKRIELLKKFRESRLIPEDRKIFIAYKGDYINRIIMPLYDECGDIIYFQARRIPGSKIWNKYKNPKKPKELIIPNQHLFNSEKPVVIVEGILDSYMVGTQGTSCLGKEISEDFLEKLFKICKEKPIISLDNDSEGYKGLRKFMQKNKFAQKVNYFIYPIDFSGYDDLNSIARGKKIRNVYEIVLNNSVDYSRAILKLKLLEGSKNENYTCRN